LATELVKELIDSGIHFGHRVSRWNPKMKPYIFGKRNLIHIINVKETLKGLLLAKRYLSQVVADGKDVLVVGTKRQARKAMEDYIAPLNQHWVADRWLGGTLTNFREIRKRVGRLDHLEKLSADGMLDTYSKKEGSSLRREMKKIQRNLGGIRRMERMPGAMIVIDQRREINAIREANKMGIPVVCLLDTDCDPDMVDIPIPGNDDAMKAIEIVLRELGTAIQGGIAGRTDKAAEEAAAAEAGAGDSQRPRRSRRVAMGRSEETPAAAAPAAPEAQPPQPAAPAQQEQAPAAPTENPTPGNPA
jgi:small subunit ribosomal protein S2